jgi:hypothetical protein
MKDAISKAQAEQDAEIQRLTIAVGVEPMLELMLEASENMEVNHREWGDTEGVRIEYQKDATILRAALKKMRARKR